MPTSEAILTGLTEIARQSMALAIGWHLVLALFLLALFLGWRPPQRGLAAALALPLLSVAGLAWHAGNPLNTSVFLVLAAAVAWLGLRRPDVPLAPARGWRGCAGALVLAYAWVYPHFLGAAHPAVYLYAAPMGLVPCPTLALVLGLALFASLDPGRALTWVLAAAAGFYALFGVLRLGVWLDVGVLAGAVALLAQRRPSSQRLTAPRSAPAPSPPHAPTS